MQTVETTFKLTFTESQLEEARLYVEDMKNHPRRVYWIGNEGKSDDELIYSHIAHRILSGFYNNYDPAFARQQILGMQNRPVN